MLTAGCWLLQAKAVGVLLLVVCQKRKPQIDGLFLSVRHILDHTKLKGNIQPKLSPPQKLFYIHSFVAKTSCFCNKKYQMRESGVYSRDVK